MGYVALHGHRMGSVLFGTGNDGADFPEKAAAYAAQIGMPALGITEHGNTSTLLAHYKACQKHTIKPILGIEIYHQKTFAKKLPKPQQKGVSPEDIALAEYLAEQYHLTILVRNNQGYRNLNKMLTLANSPDFFYRHPVVTNQMLADFHEGLICLSGCISSFTSQHILSGDVQQASEQIRFLRDTFGAENFFLEVMPHASEGQAMVNAQLELWADMLCDEWIPVVMTDDNHFVLKDEYESYTLLRDIRNYPVSHDFSAFYLHSEEEMVDLARENMGWDRQKALRYLHESGTIADRCDVTFPDVIDMPEVPGVDDQVEALIGRCLQGARQKRKAYQTERGTWKLLPEYEKRLKYELKTIIKKDGAGYLLLAAGLMQHAREQGYEVQGRGSVCNSLAAWFLDIHRLDPVRYDLDFDRFWGPTRTSLPDIDNDVPDIHREELVTWIRKTYGNAVPICTFGAYRQQSICNRLIELIPIENGFGQRFRDAIAKNHDDKIAPKKSVLLQDSELVLLEEKYHAVTHYCYLWGQWANASTHAGGIALSKGDITDYLPIVRYHAESDESGEAYTTGYDMSLLEEVLKVLKLDVLGLRTLTVVLEAEKHAGVKYTDVLLTDAEKDERHLHSPYLYDDNDLLDPDVLQQLADGKTLGFMQLEKEKPMRLCQRMQPQSIEDIAIISAIIRPSGKDVSFDDVLAWKAGAGKKSIIFQEDIMALCKTAGLSAEEVDYVLKVMKGKKQGDPAIQQKFVDGMIASGWTQEEAQEQWQGFQVYGFLKGHAMAYAHLCLRQAWLKKNFPFSFWLMTLRYAKGDEERLAYEIAAAHDGMKLMPPSINGGDVYAEKVFQDEPFIQQGMMTIPGISNGKAPAIVAERLANGDYVSEEDCVGVYDAEKRKLVKAGRVPGRIANVAVVEALRTAGAFTECTDLRAYLQSSAKLTVSRKCAEVQPLGSNDKPWYKNGGKNGHKNGKR